MNPESSDASDFNATGSETTTDLGTNSETENTSLNEGENNS